MVPLKSLIEDKTDVNNDRITPVAISDIEEDTRAKQESSNVTYITDWLPAEPLPSKEFTAIPT